jgi:hypothetical protein
MLRIRKMRRLRLGSELVMELKDLFNYGTPAAFLLIVMIGAWKFLKWARIHLVEPLIKNHLELIETLKDNIPEQSAKLREVARLAKEVSATTDGKLDAINETLKNQTTVLKTTLDTQTVAIQHMKDKD